MRENEPGIVDINGGGNKGSADNSYVITLPEDEENTSLLPMTNTTCLKKAGFSVAFSMVVLMSGAAGFGVGVGIDQWLDLGIPTIAAGIWGASSSVSLITAGFFVGRIAVPLCRGETCSDASKMALTF